MGSRPTKKYKIGLGLFGDGVATRMIPGTHLLQQLDSMEVPSSRHQRTGSEAGYGCLNVHPTLRPASICICNLLPFNYPIIPLLTYKLDFPSINWSFLDLYPSLHIIHISCHFGRYCAQQIKIKIIYNHTCPNKRGRN